MVDIPDYKVDPASVIDAGVLYQQALSSVEGMDCPFPEQEITSFPALVARFRDLQARVEFLEEQMRNVFIAAKAQVEINAVLLKKE